MRSACEGFNPSLTRHKWHYSSAASRHETCASSRLRALQSGSGWFTTDSKFTARMKSHYVSGIHVFLGLGGRSSGSGPRCRVGGMWYIFCIVRGLARHTSRFQFIFFLPFRSVTAPLLDSVYEESYQELFLFFIKSSHGTDQSSLPLPTT
jgi:hypothetical protein